MTPEQLKRLGHIEEVIHKIKEGELSKYPENFWFQRELEFVIELISKRQGITTVIKCPKCNTADTIKVDIVDGEIVGVTNVKDAGGSPSDACAPKTSEPPAKKKTMDNDYPEELMRDDEGNMP